MMPNLLKKKNNRQTRRQPQQENAFTFVEIVVALGIGAMVLAVAVIAYSSITRFGISRRQVNVDIGITPAYSFYGATDPLIAVSEAPSFAAEAMANVLRERFRGDLLSATAVVCLARNKPNSLRPTNLIIPTNLDARALVTPENFRTNLIDTNNLVYTNFSTNSYGNGATFATNLSIYVLYSVANATNISVDAIYECDWVAVTNAPVGAYASVRRYVGTNMTDYYHVFYPDSSHDAFDRPSSAFFTRSNVASGDAHYRRAENRPFYFVWWPDPLNRTTGSQYPTEGSIPATARGDYMLQSGATSYFFTFPAFPPL
ncbi:MAG: PulJ/GspJ family protein [Terrimicrobiaceae bacterium]